ncbi:alpha/beta fold hydrolase [Nocardia aurantiaca]|uniref:Alpha/beta fold hydrolase n=1 Tax=Nocardia aurantiaca TaxID=2675850 RepID=A0A6I3KW61_9NOCA|nr:alpha/beta hydrolase [Nocardia aurantiaca]MTE13098.1 alpha/beta fold hydrolase [Nocardia aurantiaca]
MPYVDTDGARTFYTSSGDQGRPAVVLSHGFFMDLSMFAPQVEYLEARGFRVLCWDARGHGGTVTEPDRPFSYWDSARDLLAVMDAAGVESAILGGMSQGGYAILRTALLAPERVDALILLDTEADASNDDEKAAYHELFDSWTNPEVPLELLADGLAPQLIGGTAADQAPWRAKWAASDRPSIRQAAACLIERESLLDRLDEIICPALVLRGELDASSTAEKSAALAAKLANADPVVTIPGAGHAANWTAPDLVNEAIGGFLTGLASSAAR